MASDLSYGLLADMHSAWCGLLVLDPWTLAPFTGDWVYALLFCQVPPCKARSPNKTNREEADLYTKLQRGKLNQLEVET